MYLGRPMEQAAKKTLFANPRHPYTRTLLAATPSVDPAHRHRPATIKGEAVKGEMPSPLNPPPGCVFASRCPYVQPRCTEERPEPRDIDGHRVACHFAEQI